MWGGWRLYSRGSIVRASVDDPSATTSDRPRDEEAHRPESTEHLVVILKLSKTRRPSTRSKSLCPGWRHCAVFEVSHLGPDLYLLSFPTQNKMNRNHIHIQIRIGVERAMWFRGVVAHHKAEVNLGIRSRSRFREPSIGIYHGTRSHTKISSDPHTRNPKEKPKAVDFRVQDQTSDSTRHTRTHQGQLAGLFRTT